jgi:hypothetical protein
MNLAKGVLEHAADHREVYPVRTNWASFIGHPCERHVVYQRTKWELKKKTTPEAELKFSECHLQEDKVIADLKKAGFKVQREQMPVEWEDLEISGKIDAMVLQPSDSTWGVHSSPLNMKDRWVPLEITTIGNKFQWESIFFRGMDQYDWEEVKEKYCRNWWCKNKYHQLQIYLFGMEFEKGILIVKERSSGKFAHIDVSLDWDVGNWISLRCGRVKKHMEEDTLPERIPFDDEICGMCDFRESICLPGIEGDPVAFLADEVIMKELETMEQTVEARGEYERAKKRRDAWAKANEWNKATVAGRYYVEKKTNKGGAVRVHHERMPEIKKGGEDDND